MNTVQIQQAINDLILTGGRRTTAANVRSLLNDFVESYPNINDGGNVFVVPVGYSTDLPITDDLSFVHKKWVNDNFINTTGLTTGYVPFFDGVTLDNSALYYSSSKFSIGSTSPIALFHAEKSTNDIVTTFASINPNTGSNSGTQIYLDNGVQSFVSGLLGVNSNGWSAYGNPKDVFFKYGSADGTTGNINFITPATGLGGEFNFFGFKAASTGIPTLGVKASNVSINKAVSLSSANLHVKGDGITSATFNAKFDNALDQHVFTLQDDKTATFYGDVNYYSQTASTVPYLDTYKNLVSSPVTPTELNYLSGATSSLQAQIDALTVGLSWKTAVRGATTTTLPSYTVSGGNKILTATSNGAFPTTDGLTYSVNQSILVKDETAGNAPNNGIYTITQVGTAGTPWILTRRSDANTGPLLVSATVAISEGTTLQDTQYVCNTDSPISLGVTNITFVAVGGTTYVGTTNRITVTGNQIDISATFEALLGKVANPLSQFASTTSAQLAGIISDETGSGSLVFATTPTFTTNITTPLIIGGTGVTDKITYKGTSGNGTSTAVAHSFVSGNNGGTTALEILNNANVKIVTGYVGIATDAVTNQPITSSFSLNGQLISRFINTNSSGAAISSLATQNNSAQSQSSNKLGSAYTTAGLLTASLNWYHGNVGNTLYSNSAASTAHIWSIGGTAAANEVMRIESTAFTLANAVNVVVGTTTGTKIGTSTSQKLSMWNATPIVQPTTGIAASTFVANTSGTLNDTATFDGYTIGQVVKALRNIGILA